MAIFFGPKQQVPVRRQGYIKLPEIAAECSIYTKNGKFGWIGAKPFNILQLLVGGKDYTRVGRVVNFPQKSSFWISGIFFEHLQQLHKIVARTCLIPLLYVG